MEEIKVGQIRKWKTDTNNEHFKIINGGIHGNRRCFIVGYMTDGRLLIHMEEELLTKSIISDVYDNEEEEENNETTLRELMELFHHLNLDKKVKIRVGEQLLDIVSVTNASIPLDMIILETEERYR